MIRTLPTLLLLFAMDIPVFAQQAIWDDIPLAKVSEVTFPPSALEGNWKSSAGLKIDDLSKPNGKVPGELAVIDALTKTGPKGLRSVADYSLVSTGFPLNMVTVRVFIFEGPSQCQAWWKQKYEYDGWEKHYEKLDYAGATAARSLQEPKIAVAFGRVWLTSHQIQPGEAHIAAARYIVEHLTKEKKSLTKP